MNAKMLTMGLVLLGSIAHGQDLQQKIDLYQPASSVGTVLESLQEKTRIQFAASPTLRKDIVMVDVHQVSVQQLMDRLAQSLKATWERSDDLYILTRKDATVRQQAAEELQLKIDAFNKYLDQVEKPDTSGGAQTTQTTQIAIGGPAGSGAAPTFSFGGPGGLDPKTPTGKFFFNVIKSIDPKVFVSLDADARVVLSTTPNRMQIGLSQKSVTYANELLEAMREQSNKGTAGFDFQSAIGLPIPGPDARVDRVMLVLQNVGFGDLTTANAYFIDNAGKLMSFQISFLNVPQLPNRASETKLPKGPELKWSSFTEWQSGGMGGIRFAARIVTAGESASASSSDGNVEITVGDDTPKRNGAEKATFLNPESVDPLSTFVSEGLHQIAVGHDLNVVAAVPDRLFTEMSRWINPKAKQTTDALVEAMESRMGMKFERDGAWLSVTSTTPNSDRLERTDRKAFGKLLKTFDQQSSISLDQRAEYLRTIASTPDGSRMDAVIASTLFPGQSRQFNGIWDNNFRALKFYGTLTNAQRTQAQNRAGIPFSQLTIDQRNIISDAVFKSASGGMGQMFGMARAGRNPADLILSSEVTLQFPTGMPSSGFANLNIQSTYSALAKVDDSERLMSTGELVFNNLRAEGINPFRGAGGSIAFEQPKEITAMIPVAQRDVNVSFLLTRDFRYQRTLQDYLINRNLPFGDMKQMPASFQNEYNQQYRRMKNAMRNVQVEGISTRPAVTLGQPVATPAP